MKTVLITGGTGFLGSHLCDCMLAKGHQVICMDNFITGNPNNIAHLKDNEHFVLARHDVTQFIKIDEQIDYILHFASPASPIDYQKIPIQTLKANALGTHNALGLAMAKKARLLLASTSEVYGDPQVNPQPESYWGHVNPTGPRGCYDESKRFAEALTMAYYRIHKVDTRIVRIFNTYGPRMRPDDGRAIPTFINQAMNNKPLTVFGDGKQTRSFCYVSDLIEGIYKLLMSDIHDPINLGNPDEISLLELAKRIIKLAKSSSSVVFKPLPVEDPKVRRPDTSKARKELGWTPRVTLDDGLNQTIDYFRKS